MKERNLRTKKKRTTKQRCGIETKLLQHLAFSTERKTRYTKSSNENTAKTRAHRYDRENEEGRREEPQRDEGRRAMPKEKVVEEGLHPNPGPQQQSEETAKVTTECVNITSMEKTYTR